MGFLRRGLWRFIITIRGICVMRFWGWHSAWGEEIGLGRPLRDGRKRR